MHENKPSGQPPQTSAHEIKQKEIHPDAVLEEYLKAILEFGGHQQRNVRND
jgi:hypothetical protein